MMSEIMVVYELMQIGSNQSNAPVSFGLFQTIESAKRIAESACGYEINWHTDIALCNHRRFRPGDGVVAYQQSAYNRYFPYFVKERRVKP